MSSSELHHEILPNGVEVVLKSNPFAPAVAVQCWVGVGSIDERPEERGMAHFLEHMLFKGTGKRAVGEIAAEVEACGGDINAYTTFDRTVFHLTLGAPHGAKGVELLADAIIDSRLDPEEFAREKEVILEEIRRSQDSPGARIGRRVFEIVYEGTEAGRPIIGSEASVGGFKRDDLFSFYKRWYKPRNLSVIAVGDFDMAAMRATVAGAFGLMADEPTPDRVPLAFKPDAPVRAPRCAVVKGDFKQPRLEIAFPAPPLEEVDSIALDLATFALGSGELARFNRTLRDDEAVVTSIGASVYAPRFGGIAEVSALTSLEMIPAAISGIAREIMHLKAAAPITADELARARANLRSDRLYRDETVDGQARSLGYGLQTSPKLLFDEVYTTLVNHMPDTTVAGAIDRWLRPERAVIVALVPNESGLTEADLATAWAIGTKARERRESRTVLTTSKNDAAEPAAKVYTLKDGVKLVYRHNPGAQLFTLTAATEGGLRAEGEKDTGIYSALSSMLTLATRYHSFEEMMGTVEGFGASLEGFSGKDSLGFHLQCLNEHVRPILGLLTESLLDPVFPKPQWESQKREIEQSIAAQQDSPSSIAIRRFQEEIFGQHPYRFPTFGTAQTIAPLESQTLLDKYLKERDQGPWVIGAVGDLPDEEVVERLTSALKDFKPKASKRRFPGAEAKHPGKPASIKLAKDREQTHIVYGFPGLDWADADRPALDVLVTVLGGNGGRLFIELRDKESLAYSVSPLISYGTSAGIVGSYIACAPQKAAQALAGLKRELQKMADAAPGDGELDRARQYIIGTHEIGLQRSDAQTSTMALMELYGYGYDDFLSYPMAIARVTAGDVLRVARRLFDPARAVDVMVGPG